LQWEAALALFLSLKSSSLRAGVVSHTVALQCAELATSWMQVTSILQGMLDEFVEKDGVCFNCLTSMADRCSRWTLACAAIRLMTTSSLRRDLTTQNALIAAAASTDGRWELALTALEDTNCRGFHGGPDIVGFSSAVAAADKGDRWNWSVQLLWTMQRIYRLLPRKEAFGAAVSACSTAAQHKTMESLLEEMMEVAVEPDWTTRSAFLMDWENHEDWLLDSEAVDFLEDGQDTQASGLRSTLTPPVIF